jgi:hypothetical protein
MYGWIAVAHQMGAATAAFGAGLLRTWFGSYQVAFTGAGFVCLIAALMVLAIGRGPIVARPRGRVLEISGAVER